MSLNLHICSAILCSLILCLTIALGLAGNLAVFLVFKRSWRLRTWENAFHLNIAAINLFMCVLQAPAILFLLWDDNVTSNVYQAMCTFSQAGLLGLLGILVSHSQISILRCIKVYNPCHMPKKRLIICALIIPWIAGLIITVQMYVTETGILFVDTCSYTHLVKDTSVFYTMIIVLLTSCTVLVMSYGMIFVKLRKERRVISSTKVFTIAQTSRTGPGPGPPPLFLNHVNKDCTVQSMTFGTATIRHLVVSSATLLVTFLATALPPVITLIMFQRMELSYSFTAVIYCATYIAYFLSPLIYSFRNREFKRTLWNMLRRSNKVHVWNS